MNIEATPLPGTPAFEQHLAKHLPGKIVTFGAKEEPVYGVQVSIPVDEKTREELSGFGFVLPPNVQQIDFISLKPEEHIPVGERILQENTHLDSSLSFITGSSKMWTPGRAIAYQLIAVFGNSSDAKRHFFGLIPEDPNKKVLKVYKGHGGGTPYVIGESSRSNSAWTYQGRLYSLFALRELLDVTNLDTLEDKGAVRVQAPGNAIAAQALIDLDDKNDSEVAGVIISGCDVDRDILHSEHLALGYVHGISRGLGGSEELGIPRIPVVWDPNTRQTSEFEDAKSEK